MIDIEALPSAIWFSTADVASAIMVLNIRFVSRMQPFANETNIDRSLLLIHSTFLSQFGPMSFTILSIVLSLSSLPFGITTTLLSILSSPFQFL